MINPSPVFAAFFIAAIAATLLLLAVSAQLRTAVEEGKTPLYKTTGGGRIGMLNFRGPFISLRVYEKFLVISDWQTIVLPYATIESVQSEEVAWPEKGPHSDYSPGHPGARDDYSGRVQSGAGEGYH
jgi:hypothetical protein